MPEQGDTLCTYNKELVKCFEDLCGKLKNLVDRIYKQEEEKISLEREIAKLTERLNNLNENLRNDYNMKNDLTEAITESESAYLKILETSQNLLTVLKNDDKEFEKRGIIPKTLYQC